MASKNRVCLECGENYYLCSSCSDPDWAYSYCSEGCWDMSARAQSCVALGQKLRAVLTDNERYLLHSGVCDNSSYLDKIDEGLTRGQD